jgi:hypothetical protein
MVSDKKKHQMKIAGLMGLVLGVFLFLIFWVVSGKIYTLFIIPVAGLIGVAQAYLTPEPE